MSDTNELISDKDLELNFYQFVGLLIGALGFSYYLQLNSVPVDVISIGWFIFLGIAMVIGIGGTLVFEGGFSED